MTLVTPAFFGYGESIGRAFAQLGYEVAICCYDRLPRATARARHRLVDEFTLRSGRNIGASTTYTARAVSAIRSTSPEIVLTVKGDRLGEEYWNALDALSVRRGLWLYDELRRTAHTADTLERAGPIASYSSADVAALRGAGREAIHVPLAFDPTYQATHSPGRVVTFVGARYPSRERLLVALAARGVPVRAYGLEWSRHPMDRLRTLSVRRPPVAAGRPLGRQQAYDVMAGSVATLNVHENQDGFTMRTFEAAGIGALQLIDRHDVGQFYEPGAEVEVFDEPEDVVEIVSRLNRDRSVATKMREAARRRTLAQHTFIHRAKELERLWA